jgi:prevent-host-death family protein
MRQVSVTEAKRRFSALLRDVARGHEILVTRYGWPVARITPSPAAAKKREQAIRRMVQMMERGLPLGGLRFTRDELYER